LSQDDIVSMGAASMGVAVHAQGPARPGPDPRAQHNPALRSPDVIEWGRLARGHTFTADQGARFERRAMSMCPSPGWIATACGRRPPAGAIIRAIALDYRGHLAER
jgi:hypothetical protein